jgi:integrase
MADPNAPSIVKCAVRKYLTEREIEKLMDCARKRSRYGHRDATMLLATYRHGLRASELCDLQWHQIELDAGRMHVRTARPQFIPLVVTRSVLYVNYAVKTPTRLMSSFPSVVAQ